MIGTWRLQTLTMPLIICLWKYSMSWLFYVFQRGIQYVEQKAHSYQVANDNIYMYIYYFCNENKLQSFLEEKKYLTTKKLAFFVLKKGRIDSQNNCKWWSIFVYCDQNGKNCQVLFSKMLQIFYLCCEMIKAEICFQRLFTAKLQQQFFCQNFTQ